MKKKAVSDGYRAAASTHLAEVGSVYGQLSVTAYKENDETGRETAAIKPSGCRLGAFNVGTSVSARERKNSSFLMRQARGGAATGKAQNALCAPELVSPVVSPGHRKSAHSGLLLMKRK